MGLGWTVTFTLLDICVRLDPLSKPAMLHFYSSVLDLASNLWAQGFSENVWEVSMNDVVLKFSSSAPITWFWMQEFLLAALHQIRTNEQIAGYKVTYRNRRQGVWVVVELIFPWPGAAAAA
ncbi:hypothetical protein XANCAGTX0491_008008 [Xanthoria calcicola]